MDPAQAILAFLMVVTAASGIVVDSNSTDSTSQSDSSPPVPIAPDPVSIMADAFGQMFGLTVKAFTDGLAGAFGWILDSVGGEQGVYYFLVKLPVADPSVNNGGVEAAILEVYPLIQNVALVFFVFVLLMAGLSYAVENFGILKEGTASHILSSSLFTLVVLFLILPIYNTTATMFNVITDPSSGMILKNGEITGLLKAAISPEFVNVPQGIVQTILSVFVFILVLVELLAIAILGTLRIFFVGAILVMMPLILILRLIPLTKGVADSLIEMEIGLILASLIAAIFLKFGYEVATEWGGLLSILAAFGTLVATALMPTVLAPKVGSVFSSTVSMVTTAGTGAAVIGAMTGGGALAAGASIMQTAGGFGKVFGASTKFAGGSPLSDIGNRVVGFTDGLRIMAPAMTLGGAKGYGKGLLEATKGIRIGPNALPDRIQVSRQSMQGLDSIRNSAPYKTALLRMQGTISDLAFKPADGESAKHGWQYIQSISDMDDSRIAERLVRVLGQPSLANRPTETAKTFRDTVIALKAHPQLASRVALHLKSFEEQGSPTKENVAKLIDSRSSFQRQLNHEVTKLHLKKRASESNMRIKMQDSYSELFTALFGEAKKE
ncbi:hypothetical protein [Nitrososphaera viennensis]|uniref:Uncharacterized protein n=2 Tax=Nitrososphaera viennensis TaxID=1034015 RepID=A0A060HPM6_9ARCH|nr:hypothetical protein [Nitrososphaera viennensis]AIC15162.1 hypothetical protein NVIE_009370 [Nitrososphaera viennensis EN76]UVS70084.1 hypothetical protein NWT39_04670 [Nitrososphaera viennensis]